MGHRIVPSVSRQLGYGKFGIITHRSGSSSSGGGGGGGTFLSGASSPEGAVTSDPGQTYVQTTNGGRLWFKITGTGNTGWDYQRKSTIGTGDPNGAVIGRLGDDFFATDTGIRYLKASGVDTNTGWL